MNIIQTASQKNIFSNESAWIDHWQQRVESRKNLKICNKCLLDANILGLVFDDQGICNYCRIQEDLERQYPGGQQGFKDLKEISDQIKHSSRNRPYDLVVGVSGGADSSYLLYLAKSVLGLRPLAVHFDNSWNSAIATENIKKVTNKLDIDLFTHVVDHGEFDDSCKAFLKAGVTDLDIQTDLGLAATLFKAAEKFNVKYIFEGHSFRSEGIGPAGMYYMDSKYINSVQEQFGTKKLKTLPHMWLSSQLKWMVINRFKKIRPLWLIDYNKNECKEMLKKDYQWEWYGGHHLENRMTAFLHTYFLPRRWNVDPRIYGYSGLVRSEQLCRKEALNKIEVAPNVDLEIVELVKKRLNLTEDEFVQLMCTPKRHYTEFKNYKKTFEFMRPFFYQMAKLDLVPWTFYMKYCK
jgi:N-acetyl sugar amidotransferase